MRIHKSEKLWAVSIDLHGHAGANFYGAAPLTFSQALLFKTRRECRQWIADECSFFRREYKPRPCRVMVTVEGER